MRQEQTTYINLQQGTWSGIVKASAQGDFRALTVCLVLLTLAAGMTSPVTGADPEPLGVTIQRAAAPIVIDIAAPKGEGSVDMVDDAVDAFVREVSAQIVEASKAAPDRVVALRWVGRAAGENGEGARQTAMLTRILIDARAQHEAAMLSVWGLPAESASPDQGSESELILDLLDAFVSSRSLIIHNGGLSEPQVIRQSIPTAVQLSAGRLIYFQTNGEWRTARVTADTAVDQVVDSLPQLRGGPKSSSRSAGASRKPPQRAAAKSGSKESDEHPNGSGRNGNGLNGSGDGSKNSRSGAGSQSAGHGAGTYGGAGGGSGGGTASSDGGTGDGFSEGSGDGGSGGGGGFGGGGGGGGSGSSNKSKAPPYIPYAPKMGQHGLFIRCAGNHWSPANPLHVVNQLLVNPKAFFNKHVKRAKDLHSITGEARVVFHMLNGWDYEGMKSSAAVLGAMPPQRKTEFISAVSQLTAEGITVGVYFASNVPKVSTSVFMKDVTPLEAFDFGNPKHLDMMVEQIIQPLLDIGVTEFWLDNGSSPTKREAVVLLADYVRQRGGYVVMEAIPKTTDKSHKIDLKTASSIASAALNRYIYMANKKGNNIWFPLPTDTELIAIISNHQNYDHTVPTNPDEKLVYLAEQTKLRLDQGFTVFNMAEQFDAEFLKIITDWVNAQK